MSELTTNADQHEEEEGEDDNSDFEWDQPEEVVIRMRNHVQETSMEDNIQAILNLAKENNTWKQCVYIQESENSDPIDVTSAIGDKNKVCTPEGATDQPPKYPHHCHYRFPTTYRHHDSWPQLLSLIQSQYTCPGCKLVANGKQGGTKDKDNKMNGSNTKGRTFQLYCSHYLVAKDNSDKFESGNYAMSNIVEETIVTKKSKPGLHLQVSLCGSLW